jgi:periplasmic copper chaperone A
LHARRRQSDLDSFHLCFARFRRTRAAIRQCNNQELQMNRIILIAATWCLLALPAQAADVMVGHLKISAPWARATPKGANVGGGYMSITNMGTEPDHLIGGSSNVSSKFEVHEMTMTNGVMKMRPVAGGIEIKPGQTVTLKPGGYHVMFVGMKQQLKRGQHFKATLQFAKAGKVDVDFTVEGLGATHGGDAMPPMGGDHVMPGMKMK